MNAYLTLSFFHTRLFSLNLKLYRTCVKENLNIDRVFNDLGLEYIKRGGEQGMGVSAVDAIINNALAAPSSSSSRSRCIE